ncbi:hypothetical protein [Sphingomonas sp. ERG5]|uniref:hypothetical protein n=1 Tax=Sphingomonas sp. ERG5 TaxID=1381597 RepID=UPI000AB8107E|nr:hypothetical protein [Sphingomonas sp. ERG5]
MEQSERLSGTGLDVGEPDMRKSWQTPAVIAPAEVKEETGFNPGPSGDNYLSSNAVS